jgi:hypothetical protein
MVFYYFFEAGNSNSVLYLFPLNVMAFPFAGLPSYRRFHFQVLAVDCNYIFCIYMVLINDINLYSIIL